MSGKYTDRIDIFLKNNKITWTSLAEHLQVDRTTIQNWKKRDNYPVQALETIAKLVGTSVSELTDVEGEFDTMRRLMGELEALRKTLNDDLGEIRRRL
ncbi:MAG: bacteriophage CI repressor [Okeania sp. SIO3C4]|nr:bacteriophage CI repressor [Okeania sp. SIO3C4]